MAVEQYIAIDDRCAWPHLTLMPNGDVVAAIFNQPTHGRWEGDVECWGSGDGGLTWRLRGTPAAHKPSENRMNVGGGLDGNGNLVILCSGWSDRPPRGQSPAKPFSECRVLPALLARSGDGGFTWAVRENALPGRPAGVRSELVPFGKTALAADGALCQGVYADTSVYVMRSHDRGESWPELTPIAQGEFCECDILHLGEGRWLAASRRFGKLTNELFRSEDDGRTWRFQETLTLPRTSAAHLMRLKDGRILFSFGDRAWNRKGIDVRISDDEQGRSWSPPYRLKHLDAADSGYPSSVQLADGQLVTAYYASSEGAYQRYHMGVLRWRMEDLLAK